MVQEYLLAHASNTCIHVQLKFVCLYHTLGNNRHLCSISDHRDNTLTALVPRGKVILYVTVIYSHVYQMQY